ncbi:MAG: FKBP-type peptidyl-prolyl cis-trans isomerase [Bacteroidota bacterium]|nr:FKBP-type peptidyl-prolyl cis-trans isomerase [Bacteroidota bacterium]
MNHYFKKITSLVCLSVAVCSITLAQTKKPAPKKTTSSKPQTASKMKTQSDRFSYCIGLNIAQGIKQQGLDDSVNVAFLAKAIEDVLKKRTLDISMEESQMIIQNYFQAQQSKSGDKNSVEGKKFLAENKKKPSVVEHPSGLQYIVLKEGTGPKPADTSKVTTHYHGTLIDGTVFDSSVERGQPASFPVNGVIQGWQIALKEMKVGSKWKLFVPSELAYGPNGAGPKIGPNTTLIFEVELLSIDK